MKKLEAITMEDTKKCEVCGVYYTPDYANKGRQKYCSKRCKWKKSDENKKERGVVGGGYSRSVYIKVWEKGNEECYYCKCPIDVDSNWCIDHTIPRSVIMKENDDKEARNKIKRDISNMQIVCQCCNTRKGSLDSQSYKKIIKENNEVDNSSIPNDI